MNTEKFTSMEICAGAGGQALGLEQAGFELCAAAEIDADACRTLKHNRSHWNVLNTDVREIDGRQFEGVDLFAGGVPCPPFSIAGKQLGEKDERDLFPEALRLVKRIKPKAVMLENVRGFSTDKFQYYRDNLYREFSSLGYKISWKVLNASDYGVPQLRPRFVLVALLEEFSPFFRWPEGNTRAVTVADALGDLMSSNGWPGKDKWMERASEIAPTLVGGSKKHGGADLGPTRAKQRWKELGVNGCGIAYLPPGPDMPVDELPKLTLEMVARIQGFPDEWEFQGSKTSKYRQIGNAFPPPVAKNVSGSIVSALKKVKTDNAVRGQQILFGDVCA